MNRILMTGNPDYGLAAAFLKLQPTTQFRSRSTKVRYDLLNEEDQDRLARESLDYDIFINNSYVDHFVQLHVARKVWTQWRKHGKAGFLINIGSAAGDQVRPDNRLYPISKQSLFDFTKRLYLHSIWETSRIRATYLSFGGIETARTLKQWPHLQHLDVNLCAEILNWGLQMPPAANLDHMQVSPIQQLNRQQLKNVKKPQNLGEDDFLVSDNLAEEIR